VNLVLVNIHLAEDLQTFRPLDTLHLHNRKTCRNPRLGGDILDSVL